MRARVFDLALRLGPFRCYDLMDRRISEGILFDQPVYPLKDRRMISRTEEFMSVCANDACVCDVMRACVITLVCDICESRVRTRASDFEDVLRHCFPAFVDVVILI